MYKEMLKQGDKRVFLDMIGVEKEILDTVDLAIIVPLPFRRIFGPNYKRIIKKYGRIERICKQDWDILKQNNLIVNLGKKKVILVYILQGSMMTYEFLVVLCSSEIKRLIFFGTCASLDEKIDFKSVNIPRHTISFNTSIQTILPLDYLPVANEKFHKELFGFFEENVNDLKVFNELHGSLPCILGLQTNEFLSYLQAIGIKTIDLELATFYKTCNYFKKECVGLITPSDLPLHRVTFYDERPKVRLETRSRIFESLLIFTKEYL